MEYEEVEVNSERWLDLTPLLNEEFREIQGYEGIYQISNYGRVKSLKRELKQFDGTGYSIHPYKERILSLAYHKQGYLLVGLTKRCKRYTFQVHRLVALAFIPNPNNFPEVNHKFGIKNDNRVSELEWCTRLHNQQEAEKLGLIHSPMRIIGEGHPSNKAILRLDKNGNVIKEYYSITNASQDIGISMKHISYCLRFNKQDKITHSYWKYKGDEQSGEKREEKRAKILCEN